MLVIHNRCSSNNSGKPHAAAIQIPCARRSAGNDARVEQSSSVELERDTKKLNKPRDSDCTENHY
jgi:hypothetical protein